MKLRDIADLIGGVVEGNDAVEILRVAKIEEASEGDITFIANPRYAKHLSATRASAVIVGQDLKPEEASHPALVRTAEPYSAFLKILVRFHPPADPLPPGIHSSALIASTAKLGNDVRVGAHAVVGERVVIGDGSFICHNTVIGNDARIGSGSLVHANVTIREGCIIGNKVILQPGVVIGSDGFGFAPRPDGSYEKIPQMGIVVVEDDVEIGANTTVDRATMGETRICKGVKLDNLIMVAHNVVIGEHTVIAAQTGISGSTKIGKQGMIGGQVGITGHLEIAERTKIGAQSGIHQNISQPGTTLFGSPAHTHREAFRIQGAITQLPGLLNTVRTLQKRVEELQKEVEKLKGG